MFKRASCPSCVVFGHRIYKFWQGKFWPPTTRRRDSNLVLWSSQSYANIDSPNCRPVSQRYHMYNISLNFGCVKIFYSLSDILYRITSLAFYKVATTKDTHANIIKETHIIMQLLCAARLRLYDLSFLSFVTVSQNQVSRCVCVRSIVQFSRQFSLQEFGPKKKEGNLKRAWYGRWDKGNKNEERRAAPKTLARAKCHKVRNLASDANICERERTGLSDVTSFFFFFLRSARVINHEW